MATTIAEQLAALIAEHAADLTGTYPTRHAAGKALGDALGLTGRKGGWVYDQRGRAVCQGWDSLATLKGVRPTDDGWQLNHGALRLVAERRRAARFAEQLDAAAARP